MVLYFDRRFDCTFIHHCNKEDHATDNIKLTLSPFTPSCLCSFGIGSQLSIDNDNCKQTPAPDYEEDMEVDDKEEDQSDEEMDTT